MSHTGERRHFVAKKKAVDALLGMNPKTPEEAGERTIELMRVIGSPQHLRCDDDLRWLGATAHERCFNPPGFRRQLAAIVASGSRTKALRTLDVPALVIHGTVDPLILCAGGRHTAATIPGARLVLVEGMAHDLPVAFHDIYVREITRVAGL